MFALKSPFQKKNEETLRASTATIVSSPETPIRDQYSVGAYTSYLIDGFFDSIPSEDVKNMPQQFAIALGSFIYAVMIVIFVYFTVTQYNSQLSTPFLSSVLQLKDASVSKVSTDPVCRNVSIAITGTFLASKEGLWQGQKGFNFADAIYMFSMTNFNVSLFDTINTDGYTYLMKYLVYNNLQFYSQESSLLNLGNNLILWSTFQLSNPQFPSITVSMASTTAIVFNRDNQFSYLSGVTGICPALSSTKYSYSDATVSISFDLATYNASTLCTSLMPLQSFQPIFSQPGTFPANQMPFLNLDIDVRTLMLSIAVNSQFIRLAQLTIITEKTVTYNGYTINYAYDPRYPGMKPITCAQRNGVENPFGDDYVLYNETICVVIINKVFTIPIFNQAGASFDAITSEWNGPSYCQCSDLNADELQQYSSCNLFALIYGLLLWPMNSIDPNILFDMYASLLAARTNYNDFIGEAAFNASFYGSYFSISSSAPPPSQAQLQEAFAFCNSSQYGTCSLLLTSAFDFDQTVSEYYYQLHKGSCNDIISLPAPVFQHLIETPPVPLYQSYQSCKNSPFLVFMSAVGVASGNVTNLLPLGILLAFLLLYSYSFLLGKNIPFTYPQTERKDVLENFAFQLLLARDQARRGKLQVKNKVLLEIVDELASNANIDPFMVNDISSETDWLQASKLYFFGRAMKTRGGLGTKKRNRDRHDHGQKAITLISNPLNTASRMKPLGMINRSTTSPEVMDLEMATLSSSRIALNTPANHSELDTTGSQMIAVITPMAYLPTLRAMVRDMKEALREDDEETSTTSSSFVRSVHEMNLKKGNELAQGKKGYWEVAHATNALTQVDFETTSKEIVLDPRFFEFVALLKELILMHGKFVVGEDEEVLKSHYRDRLGYYVGELFVVLATLDKILISR